MTNPWDRQPAETHKSWKGFQAYRDLGPKRTVGEALRQAGENPGNMRTFEAWSSKYQWPTRAAAYDVFMDGVKQQAAAKAYAEMAERHIKLGRSMQELAGLSVSSLRKKVKEGSMKGSEVASVAKAGVDIERVASGIPTDITQVHLAAEGRKRLRGIFGDEPQSEA